MEKEIAIAKRIIEILEERSRTDVFIRESTIRIVKDCANQAIAELAEKQKIKYDN